MPPQSPATTIRTKSDAKLRGHLRDRLFRTEGYPNWALGVDGYTKLCSRMRTFLSSSGHCVEVATSDSSPSGGQTAAKGCRAGAVRLRLRFDLFFSYPLESLLVSDSA